MARQYFRKKDPSAQIPEWIEMNGREFYRFTKSPEGRGRYFIDMDDVVIEASKAEYEEWHREKALRDYWEKKAQEDKLTILSLHSDAITENGTGEDVIPDDKVNVEEESILRAEVKELKLSAIRGHLLQNGIKKARISPGKRKEPITRLFPKLDSVSLHFSELRVNIPSTVHHTEDRDCF